MTSLLSFMKRSRKESINFLKLVQKQLIKQSKESTARRLFLTEQQKSCDQPKIEWMVQEVNLTVPLKTYGIGKEKFVIYAVSKSVIKVSSVSVLNPF